MAGNLVVGFISGGHLGDAADGTHNIIPSLTFRPYV